MITTYVCYSQKTKARRLNATKALSLNSTQLKPCSRNPYVPNPSQDGSRSMEVLSKSLDLGIPGALPRQLPAWKVLLL